MAEKKSLTFAQFEACCGPQLYGSGVPHPLWSVVWEKLNAEIFDAGQCFSLAVADADEDEEEQAGATAPEYSLVATTALEPGTNAWLVDHAWTFRARDARKQLEENPNLRSRVGRMLAVSDAASMDALLDVLWRRVSTYRIATEDQLDEENSWFLNDEVGTAVGTASDAADATVRLAPLFYPGADIAVSVMWVVRSMEEGDEAIAPPMPFLGERALVDRFLRGLPALPVVDPSACAAASKAHDGDGDGDEEEAEGPPTDEQLVALYRAFDASLRAHARYVVPAKLSPEHSLPPIVSVADGDAPIAVFTNSALVRSALTLPQFRLVESIEEAAVAWLLNNIDVADLATTVPTLRGVNLLPNEAGFCNKANMAALMRTAYGYPTWLPVTYNARTELHLFAGDFLVRQQQAAEAGAAASAVSGEDSLSSGDAGRNLWISKPHCMARSMDMIVSNLLPQLLRMAETGPKVLSKYIERPCLHEGRKFDLRFVAVVRSLEPLDLLLYDRFWPRFSLQEYSLDTFDEYEKHWTVFNYKSSERLIDMKAAVFVEQFDAAHGAGAWAKVFAKVATMLREAFAAVAAAAAGRLPGAPEAPPGPSNSLRCTGVYGADVMLTEDLQPRLLELTFSPDCNRAVRHYPTFYNELFSTMFLGKNDACTPI